MAEGKRPSLDVEERLERGTRAAKRLRREGYVPGVVYGGTDGDCTSFKVNARDLRHVLAGSALIDLKVAGKTRPVIVKDQHQHPVRDELLHIDLLEVRLDEKIETQVSVHLEGAEEAPGIKEGGVLEHITHQLNIEALPTDIPDNITVDVSGLEIAATMHLSEITAPPAYVPRRPRGDDHRHGRRSHRGRGAGDRGGDGAGRRGWRAARGGRGAARGRDRRGGRAEGRGCRRGGRGLRVSLFRRGGKADWLVVGLGNPGDRYARTRHNVGFEVAKLLAERLGLPKFKTKYGGLYSEGGRVAVLLPQTYMNESGNSVGPARGALGVDLDHVIAVHDEIDLPFGTVEVRTGGGLAGHNGLKSLKQGLGSGEFTRVRVGVGRPDSTDPEVVSRWVLGRFQEDPRELIENAADAVERRVSSEE